MAGLTDILESARRALITQRLAMSVTSHNIANVNTPGYTRQRADLVASQPLKRKAGLIGTGVTVDYIGRLRNQFIDQQVRTNNQLNGDLVAQQQYLSQIEALINEPTDVGLSSAMSKFFGSFNELAKNPDSTGIRNIVLQQGVNLTGSFKRLDQGLKKLISDTDIEIEHKLGRINQLTKEISQLDLQITSKLVDNISPNDAKDQRDLKIEELSKLVNIKVTEDGRGSTMVSVGGVVIASRAGAVELRTERVGNSLNIVSSLTGNSVNINSGELSGILKVRNTTVPDFLTKLDQIASNLINRVNSIHSSGYGLGNPPSTGNNFFTGTGSSDIDIAASILNNLNNITASSDGAPGDNAIALAIAGIENEKILNGGTTSLKQFYASLVSGLGSQINIVGNNLKMSDLVISQLENQRQAVSGVSIDEEMTNMIKYQRSFDAAAKVVNSVNELYQTILNMV